MNNQLKKYSFFFIVSIMIFLVMTVPLKSFFADKLKAELMVQGFPNVHFNLTEVGLHKATIEKISWGDVGREQKLNKLVVRYTLGDFLLGQVGSLSLTGLDVDVMQDGQTWTVAGMLPSAEGGLTYVPSLSEIPLVKADVSDGQAVISTQEWSLTMPYVLSWQKEEVPQLKVKTKGLHFKKDSQSLETGAGQVALTWNTEDQEWLGDWALNTLILVGGDTPFPILNGKGVLSIKGNIVSVHGVFHGVESKACVDFSLAYNLLDPKKTTFGLNKLNFPWNKGLLSVEPVTIPLGGDKPIKLIMRMKNISLDALLQQLTNNKASASGQIFGVVPISILPQGGIIVHNGTLKASGPGVIRMSPDIIPEDNTQVSLVRDVLKNLNYTMLSIEVKSDDRPKGSLAIQIRVEGRNSEVSQTRPIKLNVTLTGDVIDFVQQNSFLFSDPRTYLEQKSHAKP